MSEGGGEEVGAHSTKFYCAVCAHIQIHEASKGCSVGQRTQLQQQPGSDTKEECNNV